MSHMTGSVAATHVTSLLRRAEQLQFGVGPGPEPAPGRRPENDPPAGPDSESEPRPGRTTENIAELCLPGCAGIGP